MKVVWTSQAIERLEEIEDFIAQDSPARAVKFVDKLIARGKSAGTQPNRGRVVPEFGAQDIRELIEGNYRIVYRVRPKLVEVLTVFEAHRLLPGDDVSKK